MKHLSIFLVLILLVAVVGGLWFTRSPRIDTTGKIHTTLYEGASDTWDPNMQVLPFERTPSTHLTLRWQAPQQAYNHFVITISQADGTRVRSESGEHDRLSLDPDGLEPSTEYVFALQACLDPSCEQWLIAQEESRGITQESLVEEAIEDPTDSVDNQTLSD